MPINKKNHQDPEMVPRSPECRQHYYVVMLCSVSAKMYVFRIYELEKRVKTPDKYMFPYYEPLHWYTAEYILLYLKGTVSVWHADLLA